MLVDLQYLNKVCFTICIVCIVLGTVLSLAMIWGEVEGRRKGEGGLQIAPSPDP